MTAPDPIPLIGLKLRRAKKANGGEDTHYLAGPEGPWIPTQPKRRRTSWYWTAVLAIGAVGAVLFNMKG